MLLKTILKKENNNLDIFRVLAAFMVIYGHAYALLPKIGQQDLIGKMLTFDYSGSLAVKIFFFLSGLVVTNSLIDKKNIFHFLISRIFRIWPALIATLMITSFILGPILTTLSFGEYFFKKEVFKYSVSGALMSISYELPGVFTNSALRAVNGSLWSIPFEVFAYIALLGLFLLGFLEKKIMPTLLFFFILIDPIFENKLIFTWLPKNPEITMLAPCFAFGSLLVIWKDSINFNIYFIVGAWIICLLFKNSPYNFYFFYFSLFSTIIYLSSKDFLIKIKPSADISYGVYLWGWPIQQIMAILFPDYGIKFNQISTIIASIIFGFASWHFIEKKFIRIGASVTNRNWGYP